MPGRKVTVKRTRNLALNEFAKRLKRENLELWEIIARGDNPLESIRKIASRVDFPRAIKKDEIRPFIRLSFRWLETARITTIKFKVI